MPNRKKRRQSKQGMPRTGINEHARQGSNLLPPFMAKMPGMSPSSWMNDRLPEMVWAALIRVDLGQDESLKIFRAILNFIGKHEKKNDFYDITLTGISKLPPDLCSEFIVFILSLPRVASSLQSLRLFHALPAKETWHRYLPRADFSPDLLMASVGATLWHQTQEATDCRWLRLMAQVLSGRFKIPEEIAKKWFGYPNEGDQREVRPSIRAAEIAPSSLEAPDLSWPNAFWKEAWEHTPCLSLQKNEVQPDVGVSCTRESLNKVNEKLRQHWEETHSTTGIDAQHDGMFGMAFYCLDIVAELMGVGVATGILGRLGLRSILEVRINLRFLISKNNPELWKKWRLYGAGQAKLASLKFDSIPAPQFIDVESLKEIANEDVWEEFVAISLSGWSGIDLRKMSEQTQLKETYDKYYGWTSGYAHGMWGPVREACFSTCANPLHRLHRFPESHALSDVVEDAALLVDEILGEINTLYPQFPFRLCQDIKTQKTA